MQQTFYFLSLNLVMYLRWSEACLSILNFLVTSILPLRHILLGMLGWNIRQILINLLKFVLSCFDVREGLLSRGDLWNIWYLIFCMCIRRIKMTNLLNTIWIELFVGVICMILVDLFLIIGFH